MQAIAVQPRWGGRQSQVRPATGPSPIACVLHDARRPRVAFDIAAQRQQVGVAINQDGFEAALKQVPDQPVPAVERLRVDHIEMAHEVRQVALPGVQHQVKGIAHLAVGQNLRIESLAGLGQYGGTHRPIGIVKVDWPTPVSARRDVVGDTGEFEAKWSGHQGSLGRVRAKGKT